MNTYFINLCNYEICRGAVAGGGSETVQVEHHVETAGHARKGIFGGLFASGGFGGGYAGGAGGGGAIGGSGGGSYRVTKVANPGLINDIFNVSLISFLFIGNNSIISLMTLIILLMSIIMEK